MPSRRRPPPRVYNRWRRPLATGHRAHIGRSQVREGGRRSGLRQSQAWAPRQPAAGALVRSRRRSIRSSRLVALSSWAWMQSRRFHPFQVSIFSEILWVGERVPHERATPLPAQRRRLAVERLAI